MIERLWLLSSVAATLTLLFSRWCFFVICASSRHSAFASISGCVPSFLAFSAMTSTIAQRASEVEERDKERYDARTSTIRPNPVNPEAEPIVIRAKLPEKWEDVLKMAARSTLQHDAGVHEKAMLWRDLYRGAQGTTQEVVEYQTLLE